MANVTYFLGAGASYHCLPTYQNFSQRFIGFKHFIDSSKSLHEQRLLSDLDEISSLCQRLLVEFQFHNTPDTIAKKYFHLKDQGFDKLVSLKIVLILFFIYEQSISLQEYAKLNSQVDGNSTMAGRAFDKTIIDKRYDSFIASILKPIYSEINIESNFNILTWNYDVQFELCFQNYCQKSLLEVQGQLQSIPSIPTISNTFTSDPNRFSIVHLNGVAFSYQSHKPETPLGGQYDVEQLIVQIVEHYRLLSNPPTGAFDGKNLLNFAWERHESFPYKKDILSKTLETALEIAKRTEILVIIGYSFPIFNRPIDIEIFQKMRRLKNIYVQSPNADIQKETVVDLFYGVNDKFNLSNIKPISFLDYFHIPSEWNQQDPPHWGMYPKHK